MSSEADPFTFLVDALWDVFEGNTDFTDLVRGPNRIKLDSKFNPMRENPTEQSFPEVVILPAGKRLFEENDCSGASIIQTLHITIATGLRSTPKTFLTQWRVIQSIYQGLNNSSDSLYDLEWNSETIIKDITPLPLEEGLSYDDLNRKLKGWAAILPLDVKLRLSTTLLGVT